MRVQLRRHLTTILVAMVTAAITAGGPALAAAVAQAVNADKVDGKHAVGAGTSVAGRKGKLVATSGTTGKLPNNIIAKAPNADRLDGINSTGFLRAAAKAADANKLDGVDSTGFLRAGAKAADADKLDGINATGFARATAQPGEILRGEYTAWGTGQGYLGDYAMFPRELPAGADNYEWIPKGGILTAACPGLGQAFEGYLCVYEEHGTNRSFGDVFQPDIGISGSTTHGFGIWFSATGTAGSGSFSYGSWTYHVPD